MYSFSGNCAASVPDSQFPHSCASVSDLYLNSKDRSMHIFCSRIGRSIVGIYAYFSLTDTWVWKLGLWPRNSFSGNICVKFSVLYLSSMKRTRSYRWCDRRWTRRRSIPGYPLHSRTHRRTGSGYRSRKQLKKEPSIPQTIFPPHTTPWLDSVEILYVCIVISQNYFLVTLQNIFRFCINSFLRN